MCPKPNETRTGLSKKSHVEDLEGIPGLFKALTDASDDEEKWSTFTFPVDFDSALYGSKAGKEIKYYLRKLNCLIQLLRAMSVRLKSFFLFFRLN